MKARTWFKIGQIAGALLMVAGVTACMGRDIKTFPALFLIGGLLYGACRLAGWLEDRAR